MELGGLVRSVREFVGVAILDVPRYVMACLSRRSHWIELKNRIDTFERDPEGIGIRMQSDWSSALHASEVIPALGRCMMRRAIRDYPFRFTDEPAVISSDSVPSVSFLIGHRGSDRLPLLLQTLESIAGQRDVQVECVVVEHSPVPEIEHALPRWVRYLHLKCGPDVPYNRALTFNAAYARAKGSLLVLHDNDFVVPNCYAKELCMRVEAGFDVVCLKRFIFYLDSASTCAFLETKGATLGRAGLESIVQNLLAGGSLAITKSAYASIGGMDEAFEGWGGEDVEFWERARTLRVYSYAYLPMVHLWHQPQAGKTPAKRTPGMLRFEQRRTVPPGARIDELRMAFQRKYGGAASASVSGESGR